MQENHADNPSASQKKDDHDVIYTLRTAHQNQTQLIIMADKKAHILIGVISVILTILLTRFELQTEWLLPLGIFFVMEVTAVLLALLVIIPSTKRFHAPKDIRDAKNILFFGFFTHYPQDTYLDHLMHTLDDNLSARRLLATDLYQAGLVLKKKYRLLRYSYILSITGIFVPLLITAALLALD